MSNLVIVCVGSLRATLLVLFGKTNFRRWYNVLFISSRGARYWSVVSDDDEDKEERPNQRPNEKIDDYYEKLETYDEKNDAAHAALFLGVSEDLQETASSCGMVPESSRVVMRRIKEKYDHETTMSTLKLYKDFINLNMKEDDELSDFLFYFETSFEHIYSRCSESTWPEVKALRGFLSCEEPQKII